eukprot:5915069-Karenia_brevis.AAC.1
MLCTLQEAPQSPTEEQSSAEAESCSAHDVAADLMRLAFNDIDECSLGNAATGENFCTEIASAMHVSTEERRTESKIS